LSHELRWNPLLREWIIVSIDRSQEIEEKSRPIYGNERFTLVLPFFAMWPLEMHIYGSIPAKMLNELNEQLRLMLADAIRAATAIYEECLGEDYAYMIIFHQAPSKGEYPEYRLHVEFYSPQLSKEKVKYAAGIEWGAGTFTYDGVPEERAAQLREAGATALTNIEHLGTLSRDT